MMTECYSSIKVPLQSTIVSLKTHLW